jgi:hypothetical protein
MTIAVPKPVQQPSQFILDRPKYDRVEAQTRFFREKARVFVRGQDVLFHGTRYRQSVLATGILRVTPGTHTLSFTRSPDQVGSYFDVASPNLLLTLVVLGTPELIELRRIGLPTVIDAFEFVASPQGGAVKHEDRPSSLIIVTRQAGPVCSNVGIPSGPCQLFRRFNLLRRRGNAEIGIGHIVVAVDTLFLTVGARRLTSKPKADGFGGVEAGGSRASRRRLRN